MPKIIIPKPEVEKEFELISQFIDPPKVKLKLRPIQSEENFKRLIAVQKVLPVIPADPEERRAIAGDILENLPAALKQNVPFVLDHVAGWDLTFPDGKKIPCTKDNKVKYLVPLLWDRTTGEQKTKLRFLMGEIIDFISDLRNFTKN